MTMVSSITDRDKLKSMITEMTHCLARIESEREAKKDIADKIKEDFEIPTRLINKIASTMYKHNYSDLQQENEDFEYLCEIVFNGKKVEDALDDATT